jgi:hypothetical protein
VKLPGAENAIVDASKVRDYLLSPEHPVGRAKARFFAGLGFTRTEWSELQRVLRGVAASGDAELGAATPFGQKYLVRGTIRGPAGPAASLVTVWIILTGEAAPRFVTAYPGPG